MVPLALSLPPPLRTKRLHSGKCPPCAHVLKKAGDDLSTCFVTLKGWNSTLPLPIPWELLPTLTCWLAPKLHNGRSNGGGFSFLITTPWVSPSTSGAPSPLFPLLLNCRNAS